jgi:hypothetical protein
MARRFYKKTARIVPEDFYSGDAEKTKLNWFCFKRLESWRWRSSNSAFTTARP